MKQFVLNQDQLGEMISYLKTVAKVANSLRDGSSLPDGMDELTRATERQIELLNGLLDQASTVQP